MGFNGHVRTIEPPMSADLFALKQNQPITVVFLLQLDFQESVEAAKVFDHGDDCFREEAFYVFR
jgi:hypothetical protein